MPRGRLAPTPSGHLHLGNALAFGAAWLSARGAGGEIVLRIEDVDAGRARDDVAEAQRDDLRWLGLDWDREVPPQSARGYDTAGLDTYLCDCSRKKRLAGECTCRTQPARDGALRLRVPREPVHFLDRARGPQSIVPDDDPILVGRDGRAAYPLAVVVDDHRDGITEVVRGADLLPATAVQIRLYEALGFEPPTWMHVPLLLGPDGKKLSKSHASTELRALRAAGTSADDVWATLLPMLGLPRSPLREARLDPGLVPEGPFTVDARGQRVA